MSRLESVKKLLEKEFAVFKETKQKELADSAIEDLDSTYINTFIDDLKQEIIDLEIEQLEDKIDEAIIEKERKDYLKKIRSLLYEGLIVAFLVGLSVNQVTDLIGIAKGTIENQYLFSSLWWVLGIGIAAVIVFLLKFFTDVLKYVKTGKFIDEEAIKRIKKSLRNTDNINR